MIKYLEFILSNFKWYRKKKGGVWYKIQDHESSGFAAPFVLWAQKLQNYNDYEIIEQEDYSDEMK